MSFRELFGENHYWLPYLITAATTYMIGSINFAIIYTYAYAKIDIRRVGSGNAGATNVLRTQGKLPAVLTGLCDVLKCTLSVLLGWLALSLLCDSYSEDARLLAMYVGGGACVMGHLFPIYYGFKGGKGVACCLGMCLAVDWRVALLVLAAFIAVLLAWRMVSLGSMAGGVVMVTLTYVFRYFVDGASNATAWLCTIATIVIVVPIILKHAANIIRIVEGTEHKFWQVHRS